MKFNQENALVGLFVLGGFIISLGIVLFLLGYNFTEDKKSYIVRFKDLGGIKKGSEVILKGSQVGEVVEVKPTFGSNIYFKAEIKVNSGLLLYRGTQAEISNKNVIGDAALKLVLPADKDKRFPLREYDTIFANQVANLDNLISQLSKLTGNINGLVTSLGDLTGSNKQGVSNILANVNGSILRINRLLDNSEGNIQGILANGVKTIKLSQRLIVQMFRVLKKLEYNPLISGGK